MSFPCSELIATLDITSVGGAGSGPSRGELHEQQLSAAFSHQDKGIYRAVAISILRSTEKRFWVAPSRPGTWCGGGLSFALSCAY